MKISFPYFNWTFLISILIRFNHENNYFMNSILFNLFFKLIYLFIITNIQRQKLQCDLQSPCSACVSNHKTCVYPLKKRKDSASSGPSKT